MLTIKDTNVNAILPIALMHLSKMGVEQKSRGGNTIEYPTPVTTTYLLPQERVLFNPVRDANPFFHLFEALWIIGGKRDVAFLAQFNPRMKEYSDDGEVFNAAYGYRMRHEQGFDQLALCIEILKNNPDSRQAVVQLWDAERDLRSNSKDKACNDLIMFKVRNGKLNMTVMNRSNDLIWGAYGANVVHFSMLQEYVANKIGVPLGVYNQVSDSLHVYTDNPQWNALKDTSLFVDDPYDGLTTPYPLVAASDDWDYDLLAFLDNPFADRAYKTVYFTNLITPMVRTWQTHKAEGAKAALVVADTIVDCDWKLAAQQWLQRRVK